MKFPILLLHFFLLFFNSVKSAEMNVEDISFINADVEKKLLPKNRLSFQELIDQNFKSYLDLLRFLKKRDPDLFLNEVLIHRSRSLQVASKEFPRVILFNHGMVFSFGEHPDNGTPRVEILEFDSKVKRFQPREIIFQADKARYEKSPRSCTACHGDPVRPIWSPYDFWPNAFGSHISRTGSLREKQYLEDLWKEPKGIFNFLPRPHDKNSSESIFQINSIEPFSTYITYLNLINFVKVIDAHKIDSFHPALYFVLQRCHERNGPDFLTLFPESTKQEFRISYEQILNDTSKARAFLKKYQKETYRENFNANVGETFNINHNRLEKEIETVAMLRFILENNGLSLRNYLQLNGINDYFFSTPSNFSYDLLNIFKKYSEKIELHGERTICTELKKESLKRLRENSYIPINKPMTTYNSPGKDLPVIGRCTKCHSLDYPENSRRAPYIPFDDSLKFKQLLKTTDLKSRIHRRINLTGPGRMPIREALTIKEKEALTEAIELLSM